jgi:hypothetical protein
MLDNYKSIPFLAGVSILLMTSLSIGAFVYSSLRADSTDQSTDTAGESKTETDSFGRSGTGGSDTESNLKSAPLPSVESSGASSDTNSTTGIPTGKYSNPPTTLETGSEDLIPNTSQRPSENFESSVDRNRAIQQTMNDSINDSMDPSIPDYSAPASSNNYNDTQDNSLLEPLEDDSLLEAPTSTSESTPQTAPLSPVTEPSSPSSLSSPSSSSSLSQP